MSSTIDLIYSVLKEVNFFKYFPRIDEDLLLLSFVSNDRKYRQIRQELLFNINLERLAKMYHLDDISYETLEFYGDKVFGMVVTDIVKKKYGLSISPKEATQFVSSIVANRIITDISIKIDLCPAVFDIKKNTLPLHNVCADTFEALLGAVYFSYGLDSIKKVEEWLLSIEEFDERLSMISLSTFESQQGRVANRQPQMMITRNQLRSWDYKRFEKNYFTRYKQMKMIERLNEEASTEEEQVYDIFLRNNYTKEEIYFLSYSSSITSNNELEDQLFDKFIDFGLWNIR